MTCTAVLDNVKRTDVGMGQIVVAAAPARMTAVLGSCVGVCLYHPRLHVGALGHVVLPRSNTTPANPGKFADTAIPHMLELLAQHGAVRGGLIGKIAGGACMFHVAGPMQIGDANIKAVLEALRAAGVRVGGQDLGGCSGRRLSMDCHTGLVTVQIVGGKPRIL